MKTIAEAPSKVIITGEHFVVHGSWALAAALEKKVRVEVQDSEKLEISSDRFTLDNPQGLIPALKVVRNLSEEFSFKPKCRIVISSQIPDGSGLGSSASTMVALTSAVSKQYSLGLGRSDLMKFSMVGEKEIHGRPSGVDVAVCVHGGVICFKIGMEPRRVRFEGPRSFLVVFSGVSRSTRQLIRRVSAVKGKSPRSFTRLANSAERLSLEATSRLVEGDMEGLGRTLTASQSLLASIGASTSELDSLVSLMLSLGCYGAKLTGAGGGGCVLAVAPEGKEKRIISRVTARGFEGFVATVPVGGVKAWVAR